MNTIPCLLACHAMDNPDDPCILTDTKAFSYQEVHEKVSSLALFLQRQKIGKGSRVAFLATHTMATILLFYALFRLQAIACPLSPKTPERQIPSLLNQLQTPYYYLPEHLPFCKEISPISPIDISPSSLATFLFTSGSSAKPKIATHSWYNHYYNARGSIDALQLDSNCLYLLSLPLFHVSGIAILFRSLVAKTPLLLSNLPLEQAVLTHPVTHLSLVPTQLHRLVQSSLACQTPSSLHCILLGGAPAPPSLIAKASHLPLFLTYGMTEMSSMISLNQKILPFREVKIEKGEIFVKGKTLFQGYFYPNNSLGCLGIDQTPIDGWFATNDCGYFEGENLFITGRKDRQFISGGENIQPEEIERALLSISFITKARIFPKEDAEFGQRPCAYIESSCYDLATIRKELSHLLPRFKHPVEIYPFTPSMAEKEF